MYALVTGATSGIGREIAGILAMRQSNLILVGRRQERLEQQAAELKALCGVQVVTMVADLSVTAQVRQVYEDCLPYDVRVVVNCAGFGKIGDFRELPLSDELSMIQTNVVAVHMLTKLFASHMTRGCILNVASMAAFQPTPMMAAYGASKAYVLQYSQAVNHELSMSGSRVRVAALCPGPVDTEFNDVAGGHFTVPSMSARRCAMLAVDGLIRGRSVIIPGLFMKLTHLASKLAPTALVLKAQYTVQSGKK